MVAIYQDTVMLSLMTKYQKACYKLALAEGDYKKTIALMELKQLIADVGKAEDTAHWKEGWHTGCIKPIRIWTGTARGTDCCSLCHYVVGARGRACWAGIAALPMTSTENLAAKKDQDQYPPKMHFLQGCIVP